MGSLEALVAQIQGLSSSAGDISRLHVILKQAEDSLRSESTRLSPILNQLDPAIHSLGYLYILEACTYAPILKEQAATLVPYIARFISFCVPEQIRLAPDKFISVCKRFKDQVVLIEAPIRGVAPMLSAVQKLGSSSEHLTSLHPEFLLICLLAKCYKTGLSILEDDIFEVDQPRDFFLYCYYGGMICIGQKRFRKALELLHNAVTAPMSNINAIAIEAYKKYIMVSLIHHGQLSTSLPKYTSSAAQRHLKNFCQPYIDLASSYSTGKIAELEAYIQTNREHFESDNNLGLVKQVVSSMYKRNIQRLTQTYLTLSLQDIANTVQLNSPKEAEMHVLQMIQDGEIFATINQKDGMVRFLEDPEQYKSKETFLALWLSALRLVQRGRDPPEGPVPVLEARLCVLLSIVPLAIANVLEDEAKLCRSSIQGATAAGYVESGCRHKMNGKHRASRKDGLFSSLQVLGHFSGLLCPPASVVDEANSAARKAASFITNAKNERNGIGGGSHVDTSIKAGGNMRHLIVEACIARSLIDTSAYVWPGYVSASIISLSDSSSIEKSPWLIFMEGAPLNGSLINSLFTTPASSLAEIEKLYYIALNGSEEEKSTAAKILCGASLSRGWNIQEHVVRFVVKLLSPPVPPSYTGPGSHLVVDYTSMLCALLLGASSVDTVHILSLHGAVPEVAASLMALCEAFGSAKPTSSNKSSKGDEPSIYMVFSLAFLYLLRLWKFYRAPLEQCISERGVVGVRGEVTLEYLLLLRNSSIASCQVETNSNPNQSESAPGKPIYIHSYPKLSAWYCQNKSCIASTLAGLSSGNPVHQVANKILSMIYWKMTKGVASAGNSSTPTSSGTGSSPASTGEDDYQRPVLPAWEVLEAIPFVLEAILTACAHGRLSSRDLTTGLRDLVDFLPASLAVIVSYFSAEVTRGIWRPVPMNGKDWPSPAAILPSVLSEIKAILAAVGVDLPSCSPGNSLLMLPLPMAALVSLTITFKLEKSMEFIHSVAGLAMEHCASGCPWPTMHIIGSLWAQKVRRWHDFIVVSSSRSIFRQNKEAVSQLLKSCFTSFLGSFNISTCSLNNKSSINGLLGSTISAGGVCRSIAPGLLYLRSCRTIQNVDYVNDIIVGLVAEHARELAARWASRDSPRLKSSQASLSMATTRAREVASLGASLLCATGGAHLVQELFRNTIPTWLLSSREEKLHKVSAVSRIVEGYAMAYLLILSGSILWGVEVKPASLAFARRARIVEAHMDFLAGVLEGNISLACDPATWKAYLSCLVGLMVRLTPAWIQEVKLETLRKLASGLRGWHECELALSLLERGGTAAIGSVAELVNIIS